MNDLSESLLRTRHPRRTVLRAAAAAAVAALLIAPAVVSAQEKKADPNKDYSAELMKPGSLPDLVLGKTDAPVTIVEYASMTCSHCASFHNTVLPKLKEKYIDTGKARLIMREFPLDNLAAAASMLARCAGDGKSHELISAFFAKQDEWAFVQGSPIPAMFKIASEHGFTKESFDKCLTDQKLLEGITATRDKANKTFQVRSTPTFFVNGKKLDRADDIQYFDKALEPLLKQ